ncbi:Gfo/Idh/MocA family oxidoreductase [Kitasatospora sp. NPDC049258]|uniref:Gfo/Idh/MocA family protein n=1 Tax=Kitasatospora sp. NPDC049258 TaxID=3155394 RepID=UPI003432FA32
MTLGVGLVGFGVAGRRHAAALEGSGVARIRSVLVPDRAADLGPLRRSSGWAELLGDPEVELVALCTPPGGRAELAEQALAAGKAVLLERPAACSPAEVDRLLAVSRRVGRPVGVMFQHRRLIPEQVLRWDWGPGATAVLHVSRFRPTAHYHRAGWRHDPARALGGVGAHLGAHYLDLACQVLGEPAAVHVVGRREVAAGIDSRIAGVVDYRGGATLGFAVTAESTVRVARLEVLGADCRLLVQDGEVTTETGGVIEDHPALPGARLRLEVYRDMAEALATGKPPRHCGLDAARAVTTILHAVTERGVLMTAR